MRFSLLSLLLFAALTGCGEAESDPIAHLQADAIASSRSAGAHWGRDPDNYTEWSSHTNRLVPVYTFGTRNSGDGISLSSYAGENSLYRDEAALADLYGYLPEHTLNPEAEYFDQTDLYQLQKAAVKAEKKHVFLVIFDGMDWQSTQAAAVARTGRIYNEGKGSGLFFQNYDAGGTSEYGYVVTSPADDDHGSDVNSQTPKLSGRQGGYDAEIAGAHPWSTPTDADYLVGKMMQRPHIYPDSAASATSLMSGIKTYNNAINVTLKNEQPVETIAHQAQQAGYRVGAVSSVPISHATPGATYARNVSRNDYQDISRDLLGLPSISRPDNPLPGLDVLIGTGIGIPADPRGYEAQGENYDLSNHYLADSDLRTIQSQGNYVVSLRTDGVDGGQSLRQAAEQAAGEQKKLFGFYGTQYKHLPFATANGDYKPVADRDGTAQSYTQADLHENPTLAEMTEAAITVLSAKGEPFWLMVEPGDVDWAAHNNNLDNVIGAVYSGEEAVKVIARWVETNSSWDESIMIVTADHGLYLVVNDPAALHQ